MRLFVTIVTHCGIVNANCQLLHIVTTSFDNSTVQACILDTESICLEKKEVI